MNKGGGVRVGKLEYVCGMQCHSLMLILLKFIISSCFGGNKETIITIVKKLTSGIIFSDIHVNIIASFRVKH